MGKTLPWKTKLAALKSFKDREGHTLVRQSYVCPDTGFRLGRWVANLRQRADFLSESQLDDLDRLDFVWSRFKVLPWDQKVEILRKYKMQHGHTLVPKDHVDRETGFHLGWWVDRMRQGKNTMNEARVQDLEHIGFVWNAFDATWESMFHLLKEYNNEYHHSCPKISEMYKGKPLGHWVGMQRQLYARRQRSISELKQMGQQLPQTCANNATTIISDKRIEMLESIGFVWRLRTSGASEEQGHSFGTDGSLSSSSMTGSDCTPRPASPNQKISATPRYATYAEFNAAHPMERRTRHVVGATSRETATRQQNIYCPPSTTTISAMESTNGATAGRLEFSHRNAMNYRGTSQGTPMQQRQPVNHFANLAAAAMVVQPLPSTGAPQPPPAAAAAEIARATDELLNLSPSELGDSTEIPAMNDTLRPWALLNR